ncbi:TonB family protein [Hymenobacter yonginensis]|uniref:TonB family protein n=1 Tax=Hymenobacter yonginensis TaxID=748197 RepID=A0ABY7PNR1_9BACT|nr:TonB family protein [Hymenobacter yonginensis]WBO84627.1 TonB family protein [Hymenobacter yonginensis]
MHSAVRTLAFIALCGPASAVAQTASPTRPGTEQVVNKIYTYVEQMPEFPGGQPALFRTLGQTIVYPAEALQQGLEGKVFVSFVVAVSGQVQDVKVSKSVHPLLDAEALRAVQALPAFVPGKQNGRPVAVAYTLPIAFRVPAEAAPAATAPVAPLLTGPRPAAKEGRSPHLQGGQEALAEYLKTVAYPADAQQAQASGLIVVDVTVGADGKVSKVGTDNGIGLQNGQATRLMPTLRFAAISLLNDAPAWVPGQLKGKNVSSNIQIPLQFDAASGTVSIVPGLRLFPDEGPAVPGGPEALLRTMSQRLQYPMEALRNQRQGKVVLFLQVSEAGRLEQPLVVGPVSPELDAEALRVATLLPPVFPALEQGKPVRSYYLLPVVFEIRE